ncbi:MAG: hypothetical protein P4L82_05625 [Ancalomicrobiaceae bacterium]|nr:hypothetical protein [Ancalomicrobiaceae bacterium]
MRPQVANTSASALAGALNGAACAVIAAAGLLLLAGLGAGRAEAAGDMTPGRGVQTDQRIDLPLDPAAGDAPRPANPVGPVRVAAGDDNVGPLKGVAQRVAPLEVVARADRPDLVWNAAEHTLADRGQIVAYDVDAADIARAADRVALVRVLRDLAQKAGQPVKVLPDDRMYQARQHLDIQVAETRGRFALVFAVSGDGTLQLLYPQPTDPAQVADGTLTISVEVGPPFGVDQVVALTAAAANPGLVQAVRRLDRRKAAGDLLGLIEQLPEGSCRFGLAALATQP